MRKTVFESSSPRSPWSTIPVGREDLAHWGTRHCWLAMKKVDLRYRCNYHNSNAFDNNHDEDHAGQEMVMKQEMMMRRATRKWLKTSARRCVRCQRHKGPEQELPQILQTKSLFNWCKHIHLNISKSWEIIDIRGSLTFRVLMAMIWRTPWVEVLV